ncbi:MAG: rhomboid family intramembrane serine protease [Candidatus Geothermarchaeales archaeon]
MFPLYDENPRKTKPFITWSLIAINVVVFAWQLSRGMDNEIVFEYGEIPAMILSGRRLFTMITSMFLHGDIFHIFGNMLYLFIFGDNIEDRFGHTKFLLLYLLFGVFGGLTHSVLTFVFDGTGVIIPAIGASGAISGVLGAYLMFFPRAKIVSVILFFYFLRIARVPALIFLGFWFLLQFLYGATGTVGGVAYWAHIGGFAIGFLTAGLYKLLGQ